MNGERIERAVSLVLSLAAVVILAVLGQREFFARGVGRSPAAPPVPPDPYSIPPVFYPEWRRLLDVAVRDDTSDTPVIIVEFGDFECPACRRFEMVLDSARIRFASSLSVAFVHFPLPQHRFARPAARAAECARSQGRFGAMARSIYRFQDSLGLRPWSTYASEAGVKDTAEFNRCIAERGPVPAVEAGFEAGKQIGLSGTPTVIVNGWRYRYPPTAEVLFGAIGDLLAGRSLGAQGQ
jgi:protein-disulfide isomerase